MGVKDLWQLLAPIGRQISIETLEGKRLAIDISIWIHQFINSMKDDDGKTVKQAHLIGTLRRILKLLHHRIRPVFVFDGQTPLLKLQTIRARRLQRDKQEINVRKAAEKLLLERLKASVAATTAPVANLSTPEEVAEEEEKEVTWVDEVTPSDIKPLQQGNSDTDSNDGEEVYSVPAPDELDPSSLASLPLHLRKHIIESWRRTDRLKKRSSYLPVASDPQLYSQTQVAHFLKTSAMNRRFQEASETAAAGNTKNSSGRRIAGDGNREFILHSTAANGSNSSVPIEETEVVVEGETIMGGFIIDDDSEQNKDVMSHMAQRSTAENIDTSIEQRPIAALEDAGFSDGDIDNDVHWQSDSEEEERGSLVRCKLATHTANEFDIALADVVAQECIDDSTHGTPAAFIADVADDESEINATPANGPLAASIVGVADDESETDVTPVLNSSYGGIDASAAERLVQSASSLGDWATRVVQKTLKSHMQQQQQHPRAQSQQTSPLKATDAVNDGKAATVMPCSVEEKVEEKEQIILEEHAAVVNEYNLNSEERLVIAEEEYRSAVRSAQESISDAMFEEVRDLLNVFGLPYIIAPFEAEAQCAELEQLGLVDGIVTEDSDVFLFGGRTVYKHIFADKKHVEMYLASAAASELGITRDKFICLAYLLGGDYCSGVHGVGIVNAMEIVSAFSTPTNCDGNKVVETVGDVIECLGRFKLWLQGGFEAAARDKLKLTKQSNNRRQVLDESEEEDEKELNIKSDEDKKIAEFDATHRGARLRWTVPEHFPDRHVAEAYLHPQVSHDATSFEWKRGSDESDEAVRRYCCEVLHWTPVEIKRILNPVLERRQQNSGGYQRNIEAYFKRYEDGEKAAVIRSKRLSKAVSSNSNTETQTSENFESPIKQSLGKRKRSLSNRKSV